jgi:heat shock protein HslJ
LAFSNSFLGKFHPSIRLLFCLSIVLILAAACYPPATPLPPATSAPSSGITNIVWQWTSVTSRSTGQTTQVANPQAYTITFFDDGTLSGQADCNTFTK